MSESILRSKEFLERFAQLSEDDQRVLVALLKKFIADMDDAQEEERTNTAFYQIMEGFNL